MIEAVGSGGRDGLIGGDKGCLGCLGCLGCRHGHVRGQELERAHLLSVAALLGPSPEARHEYAVLATTPTTPTTTTNNNALDSIPHNDNTVETP